MKNFLFAVITILSIYGCSGKQQKAPQENMAHEILSIEDTYSPKYKIVKAEDISYKDRGVTVARILYRVTFPKGLSSTDIYDSFRYLTKKTYEEKSIRNISIFAYYPNDDVESAYTIGMFEVDLSQDTEPKFEISNSYFKEEKELMKKGDVVALITKEEYDKKTKEFVPAKRTKISNSPSDFTNCDYIPNGTEAKITDVFKKRLTSEYTWISYKVYIAKIKKEVWVSEYCVVSHKAD